MRSGAGAALRSPTDEAARSRCAPLAEQIGARAMVPAIGVAAKAVTTLAMSGPSAEPQPDSARIRPTLIRRVTSRHRSPAHSVRLDRRGRLLLPRPSVEQRAPQRRGCGQGPATAPPSSRWSPPDCSGQRPPSPWGQSRGSGPGEGVSRFRLLTTSTVRATRGRDQRGLFPPHEGRHAAPDTELSRPAGYGESRGTLPATLHESVGRQRAATRRSPTIPLVNSGSSGSTPCNENSESWR